MKELKCPKCGNVFKVDEADYAAIVGQVKNAEFNQEVERRMKELEKQQKAEQKAETLKAEQNYQKLLSEKELNLTQKDAEIAKLQSQLEGIENTNQLSLAKEIAKKDKEIAALQTQLSSNESKLRLPSWRSRIRVRRPSKRRNRRFRNSREIWSWPRRKQSSRKRT